MALLLRWRGATTLPVEIDGMRPDRLAALAAYDVARLPALVGNRACPLGELFTVAGDGGDGVVRVEGEMPNVARIGWRMSGGRLQLHGRAGPYLGAEMSGGTIELSGDCADWMGAEMRGGRMTIRGNAGDWAGAAYPGSRIGMRGGAILVQGRTGDNSAVAMRRGLIAVRGAIGAGAARGMVAGSLLAFEELGSGAGLGMKRGTIALWSGAADPEETLLPTFLPAGRGSYPFLGIYWKQLDEWGFPLPEDEPRDEFDRYNGDTSANGQGEILITQR